MKGYLQSRLLEITKNKVNQNPHMFYTDSNEGIVDGYDNEFVLDFSIKFISILRSKLPLIISGKKFPVDREFIEFLLIESFRSLL